MDRRIGRVEATALALVLGQLASWDAGLLAALAGVVLAVIARGATRGSAVARVATGGVLVLASAAAGSGLAAWRHAVPAHPEHVRALVLPWRGEVDAVVVDGPWRTAGRERMTVDVLATRRGGEWRRRHGRLAVAIYGPAPAVVPGTRLRARLSVREPRAFRNPGSFDRVGHLARRGVHATASLSSAAAVVVVTPGEGRWRGLVARWRRRVAARVERLPVGEARAVLLALVVGHQGEISPELRSRFVRAGVAHVLAISGLHVGLVAWMVARLAALALARSRALASRVGVDAAARMVACGPAALYCALGGLGPSVLRAGAAVAIVAVAGVADRRPGGLRVLALAVIALAFLEPGLARDVGFQLSVAAVAGLVLGGGARGGRMRQAAGASLGAWIATAPLLAHHFQEVSPAGALLGPLLLPFFGLGPVALGVAGALVEPASGAIADACLASAAWMLGPGLRLVDVVARTPGAELGVPRPSAAELAGAYALLATLTVPALRRRRWPLVLALAVGIADVAWWVRVRSGTGRLVATFLDVGQGDAAVVELPAGHVLVVDGGGFPGSDFDVGRAVVAPYLRARKVRRVEVVVATHAHPDHFGGLATVIERFRPRELWWPGVGGEAAGWGRIEAAARAAGTTVRVVSAGTRLRLGGADVRVVHPRAGERGAVNDASVVLEVTWDGRRLLLTGDVEKGGEQALLAAGRLRPVDVLKVAHHGSRTSSTPGVVRATRPAVAIVSVGADNRYDHPSPEVEQRWRAAGACVLRTDRCGAVTVTIAAGEALETSTVDPACGCPPTGVRAPARSPS